MLFRSVSALGFVAVRWTGLRLAWLLFFLPGVLLGVLLIFLLNRPGLGWLYGGPGIVLLAFGLRYFALGWEGMRLARASLDADLQTLTDLAGLPWWQRWRPLFLPQAGPARGGRGGRVDGDAGHQRCRTYRAGSLLLFIRRTY